MSDQRSPTTPFREELRADVVIENAGPDRCLTIAEVMATIPISKARRASSSLHGVEIPEGP